jgi:hypothetical protein
VHGRYQNKWALVMVKCADLQSKQAESISLTAAVAMMVKVFSACYTLLGINISCMHMSIV